MPYCSNRMRIAILPLEANDISQLVSHTFVAITFFRCAISIIGPFTFTPWLDKMGVTNMFIVCGAVNLFVNSLGIPLVIWGKRIRILLMPTYDKLTKDMAIG